MGKSKTFTDYQQTKNNRDKAIYTEWCRLMSEPGAMVTAVNKLVKKKFSIASDATIWAIRKRMEKQLADRTPGEAPGHNWNTYHDTANRTMTCDFGYGVKVVVDWANDTINTFKNGVKTTPEMNVSDFGKNGFENYLLSVETDLEKLTKFNINND